MGTFLQVNKDYFGLGLKSIDLLIISQVDEFERNDKTCYVTNEQFSAMFGESVSTIKRAMDRLEDMNIIKRDTTFVQGFGRANRQRVLSLHKRNKWKVQDEPTIKDKKDKSGHVLSVTARDQSMVGSNNEMEGSNNDNGRFKKDECKVHNDPIKEKEKKIKRKEKDNISESETSSASDAATQQEKSSLYKLYDLINIRDQYKLRKFLSTVNVSAKEALEFLEKHEEYSWHEWFVNDLDLLEDDKEDYEEYFKKGYKIYCMECAEDILETA